MINLNTAVNNFLKTLQSCASSPWVQWLLRALALSHAIQPAGWPESYTLRDGDTFDFVVVGAGTAGSVVAARLSEIPNVRVVVIEAGGDPPPASVAPSLFAVLAHTEYDWDYRAKLDKGMGHAHSGRSLYMTRGKMLGGCSSNNYELYARGVPQDYDDWNKIAPGWDWNTVLYYFKKLECMNDTTVKDDPNNSYLHSFEGPVGISRPEFNPYFTEINSIILDSYEEIGIKKVLENSGPEIYGASRPHFTFNNGRRSSTAEAYLKPAKGRPNLFVVKYSRVTKVLIDPFTLRAYGVEMILKSKEKISVYANMEVILSAGVIDTPKVLMLSGIGPREELVKFNINIIADLPVGKNLQDHAILPTVFIGKHGLESTVQNFLVTSELDSYPVPIQNAFFKLNESSRYFITENKPQFQITSIVLGAAASPLIVYGCKAVTNFDDPFCFSVGEANAVNELLMTLLILLHPLSKGQVTLHSNDPMDDPIIEMGYFRNKHDLAIFVEGLKFISRLEDTNYFNKVKGKLAKLNVTKCNGIKWKSDDYWRCYVRNVVSTMLHPVGTCAMGKDGVVDERLRVHGVSGLRVVDASIMPKIPSGNVNIPTIMIGERAADLIKADYYFF